MTQEGFKRKLAAILSADVAGYSILIADDETFTIRTLKAYRDIISNIIEQHNGRVVDSPGDNMLAEFSSVVDAVKCAVEIQKQLKKENDRLVEDKQLKFRIGVNIGDVVQDGDRIYGSGVNVAARIEAIADPGGVCVSRNAYDHVKDKLELRFEYIGEHKVKNIEEPVRVYKVILDSDSPVSVIDEPLELPDIPSIAVLPFTNMSGDPNQEYFSDGLTEQIINGLCKVPNLFVISRNSSFAYKDKSLGIKRIASELGVKYILEGSVQRAGDRVRITAQLIDATTDFHMWSENFDQKLEDIFALQDEITMKLIEIMQIHLTVGKQAHLWKVGKVNINAIDKCMRGMEYLVKFTKKDNMLARRHLMDAIDIDKTHAYPYALVGFTHIIDLAHGWSKVPLTSFEQAEKFAQNAVALDDSLDLAHSLLGHIYLYKRQHEDSKKECEKAIELNPNGAEARVILATTLTYMGEAKKAIRLFKRAFRLNPIPPAHYYYFFGRAYESDGQYENAIEICKKANALNPDAYGSYFPLISSCIKLGLTEEARMYANELLKIAPKFSLNFYGTLEPFKNEAEAEAHIENLRKAGLPE
jgi:TolB-like protein/Flp pilus assembly protein TadD